MAHAGTTLQVMTAIPMGHNFCEIAENFIECRECGAQIEYRPGYQLYTPGDGSCDNG